jgi:hypothetical protein
VQDRRLVRHEHMFASLDDVAGDRIRTWTPQCLT